VNLIEDLNRLRKENSRLKEEREILKKATAFFAKETHHERENKRLGALMVIVTYTRIYRYRLCFI
jgi:transposase-like protein